MIAYKVEIKNRSLLGSQTLEFIVASVPCIGNTLQRVEEQGVLTRIDEARITKIEIPETATAVINEEEQIE